MLQPSPEVADAIGQASAATGVPRKLVQAVAFVESRYDPAAVSNVGAQGLMQLMPNTAEGLGVDDPFDPYENALGGATYLRHLLTKYRGRTDFALAAYNWGPGNVDRHDDWPASVERYVAHVLALSTEKSRAGIVILGGALLVAVSGWLWRRRTRS